MCSERLASPQTAEAREVELNKAEYDQSIEPTIEAEIASKHRACAKHRRCQSHSNRTSEKAILTRN